MCEIMYMKRKSEKRESLMNKIKLCRIKYITKYEVKKEVHLYANYTNITRL